MIPKATNPTTCALLAASWRWTPTARLTNEVRGGFNLTYGYFLQRAELRPYIVTGMICSPIRSTSFSRRAGPPTPTTSPTTRPGSTAATTFSSASTCSTSRVQSYDDAGVFPRTAWRWARASRRWRARDLPGISTTDLATANALLATLGGYIDGYSQTFNVTSRTSGFVPGARFVRHFLLNDYASTCRTSGRCCRG